jgi:hypothetical protein
MRKHKGVLNRISDLGNALDEIKMSAPEEKSKLGKKEREFLQ